MTYDITKLSVIIPNWNGKVLLERHLPVITKYTKGAEIIIVDDCSTDESVSYIREYFPSVRVIEKMTREGFSSSVNAGVEASTKPLVLLLNSDIEPEANFLNSIFPLFENQTLFAVGLNDKSIEGNLIVMRGRGIASFKRGMYVHKRGEVNNTTTAWVSGGSGVFNKSIWNTLGGMDTVFNPFYWEDIDLSYRALKAGYTIRFEPTSIVVHKHDEGAIKTSFTQADIKKIAFRNQLFFMWKNITDSRFVLQHIFWLPYYMVNSILKRDFSILQGFLSAVGSFSRIYKKRKQVARYSVVSDSEVFADLEKNSYESHV